MKKMSVIDEMRLFAMCQHVHRLTLSSSNAISSSIANSYQRIDATTKQKINTSPSQIIFGDDDVGPRLILMICCLSLLICRILSELRRHSSYRCMRTASMQYYVRANCFCLIFFLVVGALPIICI